MDAYTPEVDGGNKHVEARGHSAAPLLLSSLPKSQLHGACSSSARGPPYLKFPCRFCKNTISRTRGSGLCSLHSASALSRSYAWDRRRKDNNPAGCGQHRNKEGMGVGQEPPRREGNARQTPEGRQASKARGRPDPDTRAGTPDHPVHRHKSTQAHKHTSTPGTRHTPDGLHAGTPAGCGTPQTLPDRTPPFAGRTCR
jgi:hypothetical protein